MTNMERSKLNIILSEGKIEENFKEIVKEYDGYFIFQMFKKVFLERITKDIDELSANEYLIGVIVGDRKSIYFNGYFSENVYEYCSSYSEFIAYVDAMIAYVKTIRDKVVNELVVREKSDEIPIDEITKSLNIRKYSTKSIIEYLIRSNKSEYKDLRRKWGINHKVLKTEVMYWINEGKIKEHFDDIYQELDDKTCILIFQKMTELKYPNYYNILNVVCNKYYDKYKEFIIETIRKCTNYEMLDSVICTINDSIITTSDIVIQELKQFKYDGRFLNPVREIAKKMNIHVSFINSVIKYLEVSDKELYDEISTCINYNDINKDNKIKFNKEIQDLISKYLQASDKSLNIYDLDIVLRNYYCRFYSPQVFAIKQWKNTTFKNDDYSIIANDENIAWASEILRQNGIEPSDKVLVQFFRCIERTKGSYAEIIKYYKDHIANFGNIYFNKINSLNETYPIIEPKTSLPCK